MSSTISTLHFTPMTETYAQEIAYKWKYRGKYSFYNITKDKEDLEEFLNPNTWSSLYFAVLTEEEELIGFYTFSFENGIMWIGFGMKPKYTGKRHGQHFVEAGIDFGVEHFQYEGEKILLSVAEFNKRAITLYQKIGFRFIEKKEQVTNGIIYPFYTMGKMLSA